MSRAHQYADHCNQQFAPRASSFPGLHPNPGPPPTAHVAIVTCMDARLDVFSMFGLKLGEAHVIQPGGGRVQDATRSLIASQQVLGTSEIMVVHHTDCGFQKASSEDQVRQEVKEGLGGLSAEGISFMPITHGLEQSTKDDVEFLRRSPYIKKNTTISGWKYETLQGTIEEVRC
jgi:carbonic anhydrase